MSATSRADLAANGRAAGRLRLAAAQAEAQAEELLRHAKNARALADEIESETPPPLEAVAARAVALFQRQRR